MTSFLPNETLTGTDVPGGALRADRAYAGMNLVLAPSGAKAPRCRPFFQQTPARLAGGTVANREGCEAKQGRGTSLVEPQAGTVCQSAGSTGSVHQGSGDLTCAVPDAFQVVGKRSIQVLPGSGGTPAR